ncbi:MAG: DUF389 domain-containing protein, partial [Campylobacterota bacterium]|nr:DUF389 domain-containing protein [Campylobacterota bacterium]
ITSGSIPEIKKVLVLAQDNDLSVGVIPLPSQSRFSKILDLPSDPKKALAIAKVPSAKKIDMLYCNDEIVIDDIRIGNTSLLKEFEFYYPKHSLWKRLGLFWQAIRHKGMLKHNSFTVKTDKEDSYSFSALGMIALGYNNFSWIAKVLDNRISAVDGQQTLLILSPTSLFHYYVSNPLNLFIHKWKAEKIPPSWGYMKSARMEISSVQPAKVVIDNDSEALSTPVVLETQSEVLRLSVGEKFWEEQAPGKSDRSSIRLGSIPKDSEQMEYFSQGLPLFQHASTEQYASLFGSLRQEALTSSVFVILLMFATMIATLGLFIGSSSVIIGAMLLAPLMQPIVSMSMGVLRQDETLFKNAMKTLMIGVMIVLLTAMAISYLTPIRELSDEMASRLSPTLLDLFVAIISGAAAAYVKNNEKILPSLAGVAIAVALVPPLAVSGIGIGWADWSMFIQALLLFATNLIGMVLAGAITFLLLGYAPIRVAKKGIVIWMVIAVLITIPLYHSFEAMKDKSNIQRALSQVKFKINDKDVYLSKIEYRHREEHREVWCEVIVSDKLQKEEREYLHNLINEVVGKPTEVIATYRYKL